MWLKQHVNSVALFPQTACFKEAKPLKSTVCKTNTDLFQAKAICQSSFLSYRKSDRVFQVSCTITWICRFPFKYPYKSFEELASPFVQVALCPGLNDLRLASTLAEKTLGSTFPSSSSFQRMKHSAFLLRHKDHIDAPMTPLISLLRWCGPMLTKWQKHLNQQYQEFCRTDVYGFLFASASVPIISELFLSFLLKCFR